MIILHIVLVRFTGYISVRITAIYIYTGGRHSIVGQAFGQV